MFLQNLPTSESACASSRLCCTDSPLARGAEAWTDKDLETVLSQVGLPPARPPAPSTLAHRAGVRLSDAVPRVSSPPGVGLLYNKCSEATRGLSPMKRSRCSVVRLGIAVPLGSDLHVAAVSASSVAGQRQRQLACSYLLSRSRTDRSCWFFFCTYPPVGTQSAAGHRRRPALQRTMRLRSWNCLVCWSLAWSSIFIWRSSSSSSATRPWQSVSAPRAGLCHAIALPVLAATVPHRLVAQLCRRRRAAERWRPWRCPAPAATESSLAKRRGTAAARVSKRSRRRPRPQGCRTCSCSCVSRPLMRALPSSSSCPAHQTESGENAVARSARTLILVTRATSVVGPNDASFKPPRAGWTRWD
jgi:hypothetical protein